MCFTPFVGMNGGRVSARVRVPNAVSVSKCDGVLAKGAPDVDFILTLQALLVANAAVEVVVMRQVFQNVIFAIEVGGNNSCTGDGRGCGWS